MITFIKYMFFKIRFAIMSGILCSKIAAKSYDQLVSQNIQHIESIYIFGSPESIHRARMLLQSELDKIREIQDALNKPI